MSPAHKACPLEQEDKILSAAAECINEASLTDFTMSAIAKNAGMSMGSIYKHIHSKEDVLLALATKANEALLQCFKDVYGCAELSPAERLITLSLLDFNRVDAYPFVRHLEMLVSNHVILERASPLWRARLETSGNELTHECESHIQKAIDDGELKPHIDSANTVKQITLAVWSLNVGSIQVLLQTVEPSDQPTEQPLPFPQATTDAHIFNMKRLINSFDWKSPLDDIGIEKAAAQLTAMGYR